MIVLGIFTDFCSCWWLWWILPFILGFLLGYVLWAGRARQADLFRKEKSDAETHAADMETALADCRKTRAQFKEALSISESRIRKLREGLTDDHDSVVVGDTINLEEKPPSPLDTTVAADPASFSNAGSGLSGNISGLEENNLKIIEGIGPKMEAVLHDNNIKNWHMLAQTPSSEIRGILDNYGDRYRIIDPSDWPAQATLAREGKWDELIAHQKAEGSESKAEKMLIKMGILKAWKKDDLQAIEGIGPKIASLLAKKGIDSWASLAQSSVGQLRRVLEEGGPRYQLADPATWPYQAQLASRGDWEALQAYQETLKGGRTK